MSERSRPNRTPIDWDDVRRRLASAAQRTAEALEPSAERCRSVLESRARELARRPPDANSDGEAVEILVFGLGAERYGIETRHVRQVVPSCACTPVPGGDEFLTGVMNLDGEILAVFDIGRALGVRDREANRSARVVVLGDDADEFGVGVDTTHEVTTIQIADLFDPVISGDARCHLKGLTAEAVGILDGRELLADGRFRVDRAE